jgi:hypothetical protein
VKYASRFDEQPGLGFEAAKWVVALIVLFAGGWLGETAGRSTGSHLVAGLVGVVTAVAMRQVLYFGDTAEPDDATTLWQPKRRIWTFVKWGLLVVVGGYIIVQIAPRFVDSPSYQDSTGLGFLVGVLGAAAFAHWRERIVLKRQHIL